MNADDKRIANATAALALLGIQLRPAPAGGFLAVRWNFSRPLPDVAAAEALARAALDRTQ